MCSLLSSSTFLLAAVLALSAAGAAERSPANAAPPPTPKVGAASGVAFGVASGVTSGATSGAALGAPADDNLLARARGGSDQTIIDTRLNGAVAGNTATNVSTGWNVIQGGSFANMSGIAIVVQNSGANVLIQNATVINLQLK
jgi:hypothetical protein